MRLKWNTHFYIFSLVLLIFGIFTYFSLKNTYQLAQEFPIKQKLHLLQQAETSLAENFWELNQKGVNHQLLSFFSESAPPVPYSAESLKVVAYLLNENEQGPYAYPFSAWFYNQEDNLVMWKEGDTSVEVSSTLNDIKENIEADKPITIKLSKFQRRLIYPISWEKYEAGKFLNKVIGFVSLDYSVAKAHDFMREQSQEIVFYTIIISILFIFFIYYILNREIFLPILKISKGFQSSNSLPQKQSEIRSFIDNFETILNDLKQNYQLIQSNSDSVRDISNASTNNEAFEVLHFHLKKNFKIDHFHAYISDGKSNIFIIKDHTPNFPDKIALTEEEQSEFRHSFSSILGVNIKMGEESNSSPTKLSIIPLFNSRNGVIAFVQVGWLKSIQTPDAPLSGPELKVLCNMCLAMGLALENIHNSEKKKYPLAPQLQTGKSRFISNNLYKRNSLWEIGVPTQCIHGGEELSSHTYFHKLSLHHVLSVTVDTSHPQSEESMQAMIKSCSAYFAHNFSTLNISWEKKLNDFLSVLNHSMHQSGTQYLSIPVLVTVTDFLNNTAIFCSAGHPPPIMCTPTESGSYKIKHLKLNQGPTLGFEFSHRYPTTCVHWIPGSKLLFISDKNSMKLSSSEKEEAWLKKLKSYLKHKRSDISKSFLEIMNIQGDYIFNIEYKE